MPAKEPEDRPRMRAVHLTDAMWKELRRRAYEEEVTISEIVRRFIEQGLQATGGSK